MSDVPNPILTFLGQALETALNRGSALDEETCQRIATLEGRTLTIELRGLAISLCIRVVDARLRVGSHRENISDLHLRASPGSFLALALRRSEASILPPGKVEMSGDVELARRIEHLLKQYTPDFAEPFTQVFGDVLGHQMAQMLKKLFDWGRNSTKSLVDDTVDYLRDESRDLVASVELEQFREDVDQLREHAERLENRIQSAANRLKARHA